MEWEDIDRMFKDYERLCRKPPTTDELVDGILRAVEETKDLFKKYRSETKPATLIGAK